MNLLHHPAQLKQVIASSSFSVYPGKYVYARVTSVVPGPEHLMIINDGEEITVVTLEEHLPEIGSYEVNKDRWRLINIRCGNPFYCIGFIATIATALAKEGIDLVLTSSFTKDLVLVMEKDLARSVALLEREGFGRE